MIAYIRRYAVSTPLTLIHLVGGAGAAVLAFMLTFQGYGVWVATPILCVSLLPDTLYSLSLIRDWRRQYLATNDLIGRLKSLWLMMVCVCIAIFFGAWMGVQWATLNAALGGA